VKRFFFAMVVLAAGCRGSSSGDAPAPAPSASAAESARTVKIAPELVASGRVRSEKVHRRGVSPERSYPGEVIAAESGRAEATSLVSGRLSAIEVGVGSAVKKGQVLAYVDAPEVGRAVADVMRSRARVDVATRRLARLESLDQTGATSKNALDDAQAEVRVAQADLAAARTLLATLGGSEGRVDAGAAPMAVRVAVRSPIDGVISARAGVLGGPVSPDRALFTIVAGGRVAVVARIPETSALPSAQAVVSIARRGGEGSCPGVLRGDLATIDEDTRARSVRVEPDASCTGLSPGGYVDVLVRDGAPTGAEAATGIVVPYEAVVEIHGATVVFAAEAAPGSFKLIAVRTRPAGPRELVVEDGLADGTTVAVTGTLLLKGEVLRAELEP
jgi:cobalt-zinc-cadmium efflux system membrane fusion protein